MSIIAKVTSILVIVVTPLLILEYAISNNINAHIRVSLLAGGILRYRLVDQSQLDPRTHYTDEMVYKFVMCDEKYVGYILPIGIYVGSKDSVANALSRQSVIDNVLYFGPSLCIIAYVEFILFWLLLKRIKKRTRNTNQCQP